MFQRSDDWANFVRKEIKSQPQYYHLFAADDIFISAVLTNSGFAETWES